MHQLELGSTSGKRLGKGMGSHHSRLTESLSEVMRYQHFLIFQLSDNMQCLFYEPASWPSEHCGSTELLVFSMLYNVDIVEIERK